MRLFLIIIVTLTLGAGTTLGQTGTRSSPSGPAPASSQPTPASLTTTDLLPPLRLLPRPAPNSTSPAPSATNPGTTPPLAISPHKPSPSQPQAALSVHDIAVADCMQMWDSGTHMTKQQWSRTCKRVQDRLENLDLNLIPPKKPKFTVKELLNSKDVLRDWRS